MYTWFKTDDVLINCLFFVSAAAAVAAAAALAADAAAAAAAADRPAERLTDSQSLAIPQ